VNIQASSGFYEFFDRCKENTEIYLLALRRGGIGSREVWEYILDITTFRWWAHAATPTGIARVVIKTPTDARLAERVPSNAAFEPVRCPNPVCVLSDELPGPGR